MCVFLSFGDQMESIYKLSQYLELIDAILDGVLHEELVDLHLTGLTNPEMSHRTKPAFQLAVRVLVTTKQDFSFALRLVLRFA